MNPSVPVALAADLFESMFDESDEAMCAIRVRFDERGTMVDGEYLLANATFERLSGASAVVGRSVLEVSPSQPPHWIQLLGEVAATGEDLHLSDFSPRLGRWFRGHVFRVGGPYADESIVGVRLRDITDERRAQERLASVYGITTVGVMFWGEGFGLQDVNEGFLHMSGFTRKEAIGKTWQELTPPEFHDATRSAMWQATNLGETTPYEKEYLRKDGSRWWGLSAARKIGDEVVEFVYDVSERRNAEAALREADRRKDEFLATLAHELRNPLAPIRTGLHIMRLATPAGAPPQHQQTIDMMDRQLGHLVRLVDDLLDVARITAGKVRIERHAVSVREVLARSIEATQVAMQGRQHRLEVDMPPEGIRVDGDMDRLAQVFSNLLSNAAKYTPRGGRIGLAVTTAPGEVVVSVTDNGVGIPPEQQAQVFELFTQVRDHQTHFEGGLGIGLSLVQSLVRLHGGSVTVESGGVGKGCRFCVRLPRANGASREVEREPAARPALSCRTPLRILVADDNTDAAETLAVLLRRDGHEVVTAANGVEAVEQAAQFAPDLALLDLGMPVMGGVEAARQIRASPHRSGIRLVALTGWGQPADRDRTRQVGFDLHLVKPVTPQDLAQAVALVPQG